MSYTTLFGIKEDYSFIELGEYGNSHLGGTLIWDCYLKYLGLDYFPFKDSSGFWDVYKKEEVPVFEKIVLLSTYDLVYVKKENFGELISAFNEFANKYPKTHLRSYCHDIEKNKDQIIAICWSITSLSDNLWCTWENDTGKWINISKEGEHWELFDDNLNCLKDMTK